MAIVISGVNNNDKITASDGTIDLLSGVNYVGVLTAPNITASNSLTAGHLNIGSNIQLGNAGVATATTFVGNLTGNVNATSNLLLQIGGSEKFRVASSGQLGIGGANYGSSGQVLTSGGSGSAATWSTIPGTTINGNVDDYIITGSGTANTLNGESSLIYTGSRMGINCSSASITDVPATSHDTVVIGNSSMASGGICLEGSSSSGNLGFQMYKQGSFLAARVLYEYSTNELQFHSATGATPGAGEARRMRIQPSGNIVIDDGNLVLASGHGIDFSAYSVTGDQGTPSAQVLDDFEEGDWTCTLSGTGGGSIQASRAGYTKVGNLVVCEASFINPGSNSVSGNWSMTLPFQFIGAGSGSYGGGQVTYTRYVPALTSGFQSYVIFSYYGQGSCYLRKLATNGSSETQSHGGSVNNSMLFSFTMAYITGT